MVNLAHLETNGTCNDRWTHRLYHPAVVDGLVRTRARPLDPLGWGRRRSHLYRPFYLDASNSRQQFDGYGCHATGAHFGNAWSLRLGPTSVLLLFWASYGRQWNYRSKLVYSADRCSDLWTSNNPLQTRGRKPGF